MTEVKAVPRTELTPGDCSKLRAVALQLEWLQLKCTLGTVRQLIKNQDKQALIYLFKNGNNWYRPNTTKHVSDAETIEGDNYNLQHIVADCLKIDQTAINFLYMKYGNCTLEHFYRRVNTEKISS
ncbi:MAG: hypothetical protein Faunusvirus2_7 [Faunusvirus sp.]|jgi:hypothetical protein|uniref:Uncharacterized protein n=1 Tax=Faunusvirus sp. TaxID=2487766 RepID=A0A3G4ZW29_9VIRU|nr:MAG: hypothetical protein Faunusvirus2_7 [Faunusvirus sp.]